MRRLLVLVAALALLVPAVALGVTTAPTATTGAAKDVAQTSATLTATVDPNDGPTTVHFDYGTSSSYGVTSAERSVDGTDPVAVEIPVTGLTNSTTYHYRVVATNSAGVARGDDRTLKTAAPPAPPAPPGVTTGGVKDVTSSSATLTGTVDPNGSATYHFEYGRTSKLGSSTRTRDAAGSSPAAVGAPIAGQPANTRIYYRLVATNAAGTRRGATRSFVTARSLRAATIVLSAGRVLYGDGVTITGKLSGSGVSGVPVVLEFQPHPYSAPFKQVGLPVTSGRDGSYRFTLDPLLQTARLRVVTRTAAPVASPVAVAHSVVRVGLTAERRRGRRVRFRGTVRPAVSSGAHASLQRQASSGRWVTIRRTRLQRSGVRSRYAITVRARRSGGSYRVVVTPGDGGAHGRGISRVRVVAPRS